MKNLTALLAGLIFGAGLAVSEMTNPAKVIAFLDVFGDWDPSLAFVMGGAVITTAIGYRLVLRRRAPFFDTGFQIPARRDLDARLIGGSALFGIGWGLVGLCPGPAIAALSFGGPQLLIFFAAMAAGMALTIAVERSGRSRVMASVDG